MGSAPYSLLTSIFALGPTVKWNSFLVSAAAPDTRQAATTRPAIVLRCMLAIPLVRIKPDCLLLLNTIQDHLVQHLFLLVSVHQVLASVLVTGILFQIVLRISDVRIQRHQLNFIGR